MKKIYFLLVLLTMSIFLCNVSFAENRLINIEELKMNKDEAFDKAINEIDSIRNAHIDINEYKKKKRDLYNNFDVFYVCGNKLIASCERYGEIEKKISYKSYGMEGKTIISVEEKSKPCVRIYDSMLNVVKEINDYSLYSIYQKDEDVYYILKYEMLDMINEKKYLDINDTMKNMLEDKNELVITGDKLLNMIDKDYNVLFSKNVINIDFYEKEAKGKGYFYEYTYDFFTKKLKCDKDESNAYSYDEDMLIYQKLNYKNKVYNFIQTNDYYVVSDDRYNEITKRYDTPITMSYQGDIKEYEYKEYESQEFYDYISFEPKFFNNIRLMQVDVTPSAANGYRLAKYIPFDTIDLYNEDEYNYIGTYIKHLTINNKKFLLINDRFMTSEVYDIYDDKMNLIFNSDDAKNIIKIKTFVDKDENTIGLAFVYYDNKENVKVYDENMQEIKVNDVFWCEKCNAYREKAK